MHSTWSRILLLWLTGVLAAAQLAKFATLAPPLRARFGLDLPQVSLLVSLLEVGGATLGFVAGLSLGRLGARRALLAGMATLAGASAVEGIAPDATALFAARAAEGLGYLLVVIAAPTTIATLAPDAPTRSRALALWSSFVPIGMAIGSVATGLMADMIGVHGAMLAWALPCAAALGPLSRITAAPVSQRIVLPAPAAWVLTLGFGCYTLFLCALLALLPSYLVERQGATIGGASMIAGGVAIAALIGSALAIALSRSADPSRAPRTAALALAGAAALAPFVFVPGATIAATGLLAALMVVASGIAQTLVFTRIPALSGAQDAGDPRIAAANGLLTQFGAGGALAGPSLGALAVQRWGWDGLGIAIGLVAIAFLTAFLAAEWLGARRDQRVAVSR